MIIFNNAKKSLGQNFLIDNNILNKIVKIVDSNKNKNALEIGAGYGNLTKKIIDMNFKKIFAVEKDDRLIPVLEKKFKNHENIKIINDDIFNIIEKVWSPGYLMGSTHPNQEIREEGLESSRKIQKYVTDLSLNENLYNAVLSFSNSKKSQNLSGYKKKFLNDTLLDYKRRGFGLSKEKRDMVKGILNKLSDLGIEFSKNISDFQDTLFVTEDEINGLPENYKMERKMIDGTFAIDMSYPSYVPFMDFSISNEAREKLRYKFQNRAAAINLDVLNNIIRKRRELVSVLGYSTYAEYRTEDRMAKNPNNVWEFENDLRDKVRPKAEQDIKEMLKMKAKTTGENETTIYSWEAGYYENLILKDNFQLDQEEVRQYFEFNNVTNGLFTVYQELFNIT